MDYTDFTDEQIKFLKYLKSQSTVTLDEIKEKYPPEVISRTFDILLRYGYIQRDGAPIQVLDSRPAPQYHYSVSDTGFLALLRIRDHKRGFFMRLFADKGLDFAVAFVTALITSVVTYLVMPCILGLLS